MDSLKEYVDQSLKLLEERHGKMGVGGFALLANVIELPPGTHMIGDGLEVGPATEAERQTLRELVADSQPDTILIRNPYESETVAVEGKKGHYQTKALEKNDWRYFVLRWTESFGNTRAEDLASSTVVASTRLILGPWVSRGPAPSEGEGGGFVFGRSGTLFNRILSSFGGPNEEFIRVEESELDDIRAVWGRLGAPSEEFDEVRDDIRRYKAIDGIPDGSPLCCLGYFAILESLLTHQPDPSDPYSSLTRQVRKKMLLVGNRARLPIPYELFGSGISPDNIWKKLYAYRSAIAHGLSADFGSGQFQALRSAKIALSFVRRATAVVIRQKFEEPELLVDLREC